MTRADLGLADAYIDGDISFADKNEGLLNLFMVRWFSWPSDQSQKGMLRAWRKFYFYYWCLLPQHLPCWFVLQILIACRESKSYVLRSKSRRYMKREMLNLYMNLTKERLQTKVTWNQFSYFCNICVNLAHVILLLNCTRLSVNQLLLALGAGGRHCYSQLA